MAIFRGTGGQGDSTTDTTITVVTQKAADAAASASAASSSASSASGSATNAATSATNAATSETNSATSETNAATSATNAATSETNAATSETNAATSETNAATSETNAATSETNAATSETNAATSATNAETAKVAAQAAQTAAETAETNAETAQVAAELAETNAETAETNAQASATTATTKAGEASTSAATATTQAGIATTKASEASASATAAASSASDAANTAATLNANIVNDTTPQLGGELDGQTNKITNIGDPTSAQDAATKTYVDSQVQSKDALSELSGDSDDITQGSTNLFLTTNERTKLSGIETGATADQTASEILTAIKTVDGSGSGLNADLLDGNEASAFATSTQGSTADSALQNISEDTTPQLGGDLDLNSSEITGTGNINITGTLQTSSNAIIGGDLTVSGSTTTVNTETINLADNNITLNSNHTGTPTQNAGLTVERGTSADKVFQWNESSDYWEVDDAFNVAGNITVTGTVDGRDVAADGTKLDGIETNATSDQTASEIRTLVDSATDSNVFTDADHTKLDGIEASATADQTAAEIRTLVESATNSNVFTDADHTKLNNIEASADVTDATNVTAAGALMDSEVTNLAQVKAFDSSDYATAAQGTTADAALPKAGGTMTGDITFNSGQTFDGRDVSVDGTRLDDNIIYNATNTNNVAGVWEATISDVTSYTDGLMIAFYPNKIDGTSGGTTFEINSLGAKTVTRPDSNTTAITTHYDGTNLIFLRYVSADDYFIVHANYNTTDDYRIRYEHNVTANNSAGSGTAWFGYELLMEGIDGKFYPVTEGGSSGNTNAVSTVELRVGGVMLIYSNGTNRNANANTGSYSLYEAVRLTTMEFWNNRDSGWATAFRPWYIVATINANGNFVLDNTSFTSFLTQDLPTSDDGKYYIHGGLMLDTFDDYRLQVNHPIYVYKNGAVREWSGYANNADLLDGNEATAFATAAQGTTADSALQNVVEDTTPQLGGDLDANGNDIKLDANEKIYFGDSTDPDVHSISYITSDDVLRFEANQTSGWEFEPYAGQHSFKLAEPLSAGGWNIDIEGNLTGGTITTNYSNSSNPVYFQKNGTTKISFLNTGAVRLANLDVNGAYTLPTVDGTNGQVLTTDGSGAVTFADASGGGGGLGEGKALVFANLFG